MKKSIFATAIMAGFLMVFALTPEVMSETVGVYTYDGYYAYGDHLKGEITVYPSLGLQGGLSRYVEGVTKNIPVSHEFKGVSFQTFCIERNEYFDDGEIYTAARNSSAFAGGVGGGSPDPISKGTAYLYNLFLMKGLQGYDYTDGARSLAYKLQYMIWWLEDEPIYEEVYDPSASPFAGILKNQFGDNWETDAKGDNNGLFPVSALNLSDRDELHQDMLIGDPVPEPATMLLLGTGLIGLAGLARKRFKK